MSISAIINNYPSASEGVIENLKILFNQGRLAGTGKLLISAVDQGIEHGPTRSFASNPEAYDPFYHLELAVEGGLSAFAAPVGMLELIHKACHQRMPTILKINSGNALSSHGPLSQALTASVEQAVRLGCIGIGYTLYPGSSANNQLIEKFSLLSEQAKQAGLLVVVWSYPRGEALSKEGETALDVVGYGAHMACLLGAHLVKVKIPSAHIEIRQDKQNIESCGIKHSSLEDRLRYIVTCAFAGRRIVIFSGGDSKKATEVEEEARSIAQAGGFGSIIGRNIFQRPRQEALDLIDKIIRIYQKN